MNAVWTAEELLHALLPTWEKLCNLEPEAAPFRYPVNPEELGIPVGDQFYRICVVICVCAFSVIISIAIDEGIKNAAKNMCCIVFCICS